MAILDFSKINRTISGNTLNQNVSPSLNLKDLVNFSTNSTTNSYSDQRQNYNSNQQSSTINNLLAINSNGISGSAATDPTMNTTPTTTNRTDGGSAGINPNTVILAVVLIVAAYFGIQYINKK